MQHSAFDEYSSYTNDFEAELVHNLSQLKHIIDVASLKQTLPAADSSADAAETLSTSSSSCNASTSLASANSSAHPTPSNSRQASLSLLTGQYKALVDLFEYYKRLRLDHARTTGCGELKFVQYILIRRVNYLHHVVFGANKRLVVDLLTSGGSSVLSPLNQFAIYEHFNMFEMHLADLKRQQQQTYRIKLVLNSINIQQFGNKTSFKNNNNNENAEFNLTIYQFEKKTSSSVTIEEPVSKPRKKSKLTLSKRSCSADTRVNSKSSHKLTAINLDQANTHLSSDDEDNNDNEFLSYLEDDLCTPSAQFRLDETCLTSRSIKFNQSLAGNVHTSLDLKPTCHKLILVLYRHVRVLHDEYLQLPLKYESYQLTAMASGGSGGGETNFKLLPAGSRLTHWAMADQVTKSDSAPPLPSSSSPMRSNVFRRMFTKSKSSSRRNQSSSRFRSTTSNHAALSLAPDVVAAPSAHNQLDFDSFLSVSLSTSCQMHIFLDETSHLVSIDLFDYWRSMWRPEIRCAAASGGGGGVTAAAAQLDLNANTKRACSETVNIYFKSLRFVDEGADKHQVQSASSRRSKLDQYQMSKKKALNPRTRNETSEDNRASDNNSEETTATLYFLKIRCQKSGATSHSTLFRATVQATSFVNDLFSFELGQVLHHSSLTFAIELFKLSSHTTLGGSSKSIASGHLTIRYADFYAEKRRVSVSLGQTVVITVKFLKLNPLQQQQQNSVASFSALPYSDAVYKFMNESNYRHSSDDGGGLDFDKLEPLIDKLFELKANDWLLLIRKTLVLFSQLGCNNNTKATTFRAAFAAVDDKDAKRATKNRVVFKLYEVLVRLISQLDSTEAFEYLYQNLSSFGVDTINLKQIVLSLLAVLRDLFDSDLFTSLTYELTLECLDSLVKLLVDLARKCSSSLFELKYSLNDLILNKLARQLRASHAKMYLAYAKLNLKFLNQLHLANNELFNGYELANICVKLLFAFDTNSDLFNENLINSVINLFNLDIFQTNYQFRDRLIEHLLANYFQNISAASPLSACSTLAWPGPPRQMLSLVRVVLKHKLKLNKASFDTFLRFCLTFLPDAQLNQMRVFIASTEEASHSEENENDHDNGNDNSSAASVASSEAAECEQKSSTSQQQQLIDTFLCLIECLDYMVAHVAANTAQAYLKANSLSSLFDCIAFYFRFNSVLSLRFKFKLAVNLELIVLRFARYIQRFLFKLLINKPFDQVAALTENSEDKEHQHSFLVSYFSMLFAFVEQNNVNAYGYYLKSGYLEATHQFWTDLNMTLKRSVCLNEYLIKNLVKCLVINCYFKRDFLDPELPIHIGQTLCLDLVDALPVFVSSKSMQDFNKSLFSFLNDIVGVDMVLFLNCVSLNLIEYVINYDKYKRTCGKKYTGDLDEMNNVSANFNDTGHIAETEPAASGLQAERHLLGLKCCSRIVYQFYAESGGGPILDRIKLGFDYNFLKEFYEKERSISMVEKHVFIYDLLKLVERLSLSKSQTEAKRKVKIYLLDELYGLNKQEKNYLQMSFIRKEQADLLEWNNLNRNESDLKEILYLKSLKKFAINSLHDKYLGNDFPVETFHHHHLHSPITRLDLPTTNSQQAESKSAGGSFLNTIQFEICKELCGYYERMEINLSKFSQILSVESKFAELLSSVSNSVTAKTACSTKMSSALHSSHLSQQHHGHLYFRIGLFGLALRFASAHNKYFLYRHKSYEMLSNIQQLMLAKLSQTNVNEDGGDQETTEKPINDVVLLHHNQEPEHKVKENASKCFLQVCAVNRLEKARLSELVDEMIDVNEHNSDHIWSDKSYFDLKQILEFKTKISSLTDPSLSPSHFYYFDRPFYLRLSKSNGSSNLIEEEQEQEQEELILDEDFDPVAKEQHDSVENLWIERNVLVLDDLHVKHENLTQFEEIKATVRVYLNPIRNAINDIKEKTKELKHFVIEFTSNNATHSPSAASHAAVGGSSMFLNITHNLQPLTMRLLGCLDARVNGGLIKYIVKLLDASSVSTARLTKKKRQLFHSLYLSIREQLSVLESGLSIHDRILKDVEMHFRDSGLQSSSANYSKQQVAETVTEANGEARSYFDHIKHMTELNRHLINCLKIIENELNDRWSKFS